MNWVTLDLHECRPLEVATYTWSENGFVHPDRVAAFHDLLFLQEGQWEVWEEGVRYMLEPGDALLLYAGRHHTGKIPAAPGTKWIYVHFPPRPGDRSHTTAPLLPGAHNGTSVTLPCLVRTDRHPMIEAGLMNIVHAFFRRSRSIVCVPGCCIQCC